MDLQELLKQAKYTENKYHTGIALGGGGARGFAHLGVIKALKERGIIADIYSGVSAGAIIGALLASGKEPDEILDILKSKKIYQYAGLLFPKKGMLSLGGLQEALKKHIAENNLNQLKTPLIVGASNLNKGKMEYFDDGTIPGIILASASIPVLFSPVEISGNLYCDGGIFENIPVSPLRRICQRIIAVSISPVEETKKLNNLIQISARVFQLSVESTTRDAEEMSTVFIEPKELFDYDILDVNAADELFDIGYHYTKNMALNI